MKYNVQITKKNIKNIILKVKSDGTVTLSVPKRTPNTFIESFLKSQHEWILFTNKEINSKNIETLIYNWYKKNALKIFEISLNKYSNLIGEKFSNFKIRKMKRRWGSCRFITKVITLNIELIKKPIECIDYVAFHEIAHLRYPHHQKEFWNFISLYMPDWKVRKERLDKI